MASLHGCTEQQIRTIRGGFIALLDLARPAQSPMIRTKWAACGMEMRKEAEDSGGGSDGSLRVLEYTFLYCIYYIVHSWEKASESGHTYKWTLDFLSEALSLPLNSNDL